MLLALLLVASAQPAPPGMNEAGVRASDERRYCDASAIFLQIHRLTRDPLALYRAAETAYAAGDHLAALRLYRTLLDVHASFERRAVVESRVSELLLRVKEHGPGTACALPPRICGDWIVSPGELCDDGNPFDGDGCDATCMPTGCGNGVVTDGEACDDGNGRDGDGCDQNCTLSACGNGVRAADEACDDGNDDDGDGCDRGCVVSACGNGVRAADEECDDGNDDDGDGCSARCAIEPPPREIPWGFVGGGGVAAVAGSVAAVVGTLPLFAHGEARGRVLAAEDLAAADADAALRNAAAAQAAQTQAQSDWATWGLPLVVAGGSVAVAGLVVAIGSFFVDLSPPAETDAEVQP